MSKKTILVLGATGSQGGATIRALLRTPDRWHVRALVRAPGAEKAQALAHKGVELVQGNLDDEGSVRRALDGAHGVHSVQTPMEGGPEGEERQGRMVATAARDAGVSHFVYSSVAGAERRSGVPHFESKWRVEQHIASLGLPATVLRPVLFMDNFATLGFRLVMLTMIRTYLPESRELQMVAVQDIGAVAAGALAHPDRSIGRATELAGDSVTRRTLVATLRTHGLRPATSIAVPRPLRGSIPSEYAKMMQWIAGDGFQADLPALRKEYPDLLTLARWAGSAAARKKPAPGAATAALSSE